MGPIFRLPCRGIQTPNESTRLTPNLLTIGREVQLPAELVFGSFTASDQGEITLYGDFADQLRSRMQHAHEVVRKYLSSAAKRSKEMYDVKMAVNKYERDDLVWCLDETRKVGIIPKLGNAYNGLFLVKKKVTELDFLLQLNQVMRNWFITTSSSHMRAIIHQTG